MSEWIVILIIVLIFFGAGKLPEVFGQAGKGIRAFKDAAEGRDRDREDDTDEDPRPRKKARKQIAQDELDDEPAEEPVASKRKDS